MITNFLFRAMPVLAFLCLLTVGCAGDAAAQVIDPPTMYMTPYCTTASFPTACTKTITI